MSDDSLFLDNQGMGVFEVTYANGEVVEIEAWTSIIAQTIAEEEADMNGCPLAVSSVKFLNQLPIEE